MNPILFQQDLIIHCIQNSNLNYKISYLGHKIYSDLLNNLNIDLNIVYT